MLNLLMGRKQSNFLENIDLNSSMKRLSEIYGVRNVSEERQFYISEMISKYGYLPHPHFDVVENFSASEIMFALEMILTNQKVWDGNSFSAFKNPSPLARNNEKNSDWFKREGHNIKLISLSALGNGEKTKEAGKFIDWVAQLITLPTGSIENKIYPTTIYLIPFHTREFGCAYLPKATDISEKIEDKKLAELGLSAKDQVKLFIALAQLAGHPVIYDVLPQTGRFSKVVLANPYVARWFDIEQLMNQIIGFLEAICQNMNSKKGKKPYKKEDVEKAKTAYIENLKGSKKKYSKLNAEIIEKFEEELKEFKIFSSYKMSFKETQKELCQRAKEIIEQVNGSKVSKEEDIVKHNEIISALIKEGLWPAPGGAWCSAGTPVFNKMNPTKEYPMFVHYDHNCKDVTEFANLDCQTPYYFTYFESKEINKEVVNFYVEYTKNLQREFNFDGFRVDHIDHIVDNLSQDSEGNPISYRIPAVVLGKVNKKLKQEIPYFATLAEYMLWDNYYAEYHKDMHFDLLWGNDIVSQSSKTPAQIIKDNEYLAKYNKNISKNRLSILKTYNNQDGEFREINQYPGQLGEAGALYKWFKYKFLPGGEFASRPALFVDGDESFTKKGIEYVIGEEASMKRGKSWSFYEKFNAIDNFVKNSEFIANGYSTLVEETTDGFSAWTIKNNKFNYEYLIVSNYFSPTEFKEIEVDGEVRKDNVKGTPALNHTVDLKDRKIVSYFDFQYQEFNKLELVEVEIPEITENINFQILQPAEFKIYKTIK